MSIAERIRRADFFRRSPARLGGPGEHKEWQHFIVHAPGIELLVNFSLADEVRWDGRPAREVGRVIALARVAGVTTGAVVRVEAPQVEAGAIDARFGDSTLRFAEGAWHLEVSTPELVARVRVVPGCWPAVSGQIPLGPARHLSWLMVPRASATGEVQVGGQTHRFTAAPAYHDHNWGHFGWGDDFAWEWGQASPADPTCPWSAVFVRMADRRRTRVLSQGLFLWRKEEQYRVFRDREVEVQAGSPADLVPFKLPRVMALLAPGRSADVPRHLVARAAADGDTLELRFHPTHLTQVLIPDEGGVEGLTRLNEASGIVELSGRVRGEVVALAGPAVFEFIRG